MHSTNPWWYLSAIAFIAGIFWLLMSGWVGAQMLRRLIPLLTETRDQIQDLGDMAAHTVGQANETMDLVEMRVSQTMGQAAQGGKAASRQVASIGSIVAGIYMTSRVARLIGERARKSGPKSRQRKRRR